MSSITVRVVSTRSTTFTRRGDVLAAALALALVALASLVGWANDFRLMGPDGYPDAPTYFGEWPILGEFLPHVGIGTPMAVVVAIAVIAYGPVLAARLSWRKALAITYGASVVWTFSLALVDGWHRGIVKRLTTRDEYLSAVGGITDIPTMLRTFTSRILDFQPDSWITHVSGHPPAATLVFVWLDRIGLGGGAWAAVVCVLVGALVVVAVPVTVSVLGAPDRARAVLPFMALMPGAVWMGVSADGLFAGVTAVGIALLAMGARTQRWPLCVFAGMVLGIGVFLSYGLLLMGTIALAVVVIARSWRALVWAVPGALVVVAVFAIAGFWWLDGYHLVVERYYQGIAMDRAYRYWVWANLACLVLAIGPATAAGLRRVLVTGWSGLRRTPESGSVLRDPVVVLACGAIVAVLAATVSGLSKSEVERIWLPFAVWLVVAAAMLPARSHRWWLAAQAVTALAVNHVLLTNW